MNRPSDSERVLIVDSAHGDVHVSMTGLSEWDFVSQLLLLRHGPLLVASGSAV